MFSWLVVGLCVVGLIVCLVLLMTPQCKVYYTDHPGTLTAVIDCR